MAGLVPPKLKALLDTLRDANLPGEQGEQIRMQIDQVEAESTALLQQLERRPPPA